MLHFSHVRIWLRETRANFLMLPVALVAIGGAAAFRAGSFHAGSFVLTALGIILAHVSVNLINEYSDWRTGIDGNTVRTPFSGGSGVLQAGLLRPGTVLLAAFCALSAAFLDGVWLAWHTGWPVLVLMAAGGGAVLFYSEGFARWCLGEFVSGLTLGSFVTLGTYYVQTGSFGAMIVWASVPPGILTTVLLLLNEFPDADADRAGGRRHLVIVLGKPRAAILYAALLAAVYGVLAAGVLTGNLPVGVSLGFITIPAAFRAALHAIRHASGGELLPAQGLNVAVVLGTDFLLAAGLLIG